MMLGLLLARAGVQVTVMEKHADFLRDFRGDTVHASTLRLLDELGLGDAVRAECRTAKSTARDESPGHARSISISAGSRARTSTSRWCRNGISSSCWRRAAEAEPTFRLLRSTEVHRRRFAQRRQGDRRHLPRPDGRNRELRADLTVACDGRSSTLRAAMGLEPRSFGAPMDVWWFRLPRKPDDPHGLAGVLGTGHACVSSTAATITSAPS